MLSWPSLHGTILDTPLSTPADVFAKLEPSPEPTSEKREYVRVRIFMQYVTAHVCTREVMYDKIEKIKRKREEKEEEEEKI